MEFGGNFADLQEFNLDRPAKSVKSSEELERLTVDEKLTDIERAVYLLSSGQEVQRVSVITALPNLLKENNAECMRRVVPKVRDPCVWVPDINLNWPVLECQGHQSQSQCLKWIEVLYVAQQDMQLAASSAFLQILQDKLVPLQSYTQTFLQTILTSVDSRDTEVSAAWLGTLLDVIDLLPIEVIKKDILSIAISKGQLQQPVSVRLSCCKILGKIATKFEAFVIKKEILPVVQQLCQDVEHEVRACMCYQLDSVAKGLGLENTKSAILPELVELTNDEESNVRVTGLDTVVKILPMLDSDTMKLTIVPLVMKFCQKAMQAEDSTLPAVARQLGPLCLGLQNHLTDENRPWFIDFFKKLCKFGLAEKPKGPEKFMSLPNYLYEEDDWQSETRRNAAFNLPAIAVFVGAKQFKAELSPTLSALCKDPHVQVRKTTASGFHEVALLMGTHISIIFPDFIMLLKDESVEVLQGLISSVPSSVEIMCRCGTSMTDAKVSSVVEVVNAFLVAEQVVFSSNNWRLQEDMMKNLGSLGKFCPQDLLVTRVIPYLLAKMKHGRALPVRYAAARSLLMLMRSVHKLENRQQLTQTLIKDFGQGRSCHSRALFIVICKYFLELYSKTFFKEHLFNCVLTLTSDPVPNIRMRACALLPSLKRLIKLPYDNGLKGSLEQCVRKMLVNEKDRDVMQAMRQAVEELDQIHVQIESMVSRRKNFEDDFEDLAKEEEEQQLLDMEERERKAEEEKFLKTDKKLFAKKDSSKLPGLRKSLLPAKGVTNTPSKSDIQVRRDSKTPAAMASLPVCNGSSGSQGHQSQLPLMIKSKSTTSIPSLSHIPRPEARPSTPPRKEPGSTRIPVYHSLSRAVCTMGAGGSLNKVKAASFSSQRTGNIPNSATLSSTQQRTGSADSISSTTSAGRSSVGSANSTSSEPPLGSRTVKPKSNNVFNISTSKAPRKLSKP